MDVVIAASFLWGTSMNTEECERDKNVLLTLGNIALRLMDDCYQNKPSNKAVNEFLTRISLLRDKARSRC